MEVQPRSAAKISAFVAACTIVLVAPAFAISETIAYPQADIPKEWSLSFDDEFNGTTLNGSHWTTCYWWDDHGCTNLGAKELSWYLPNNVSVQDGALKLVARPGGTQVFKGITFPFTSGMVTSGRNFVERSKSDRFDFTYGYVEIKARMPDGKGIWPALWLLPATQQSLPEIDIMEILGHQPDLLNMHFHFGADENAPKQMGKAVKGANLSTGPHVYGLMWTKDKIVWYLDGNEKWRIEDATIIPREPMYLIMNLAVGGTWPGSSTAATHFPAEMSVDYVRIWTGPR